MQAEITLNIERALGEDLGDGDVTAALLQNNTLATADIIAREDCVLCGQAWASETFSRIDSGLVIRWLAHDGEQVSANTRLCEISGDPKSILTAERVALNFLQTLSATATKTASYVRLLDGMHTQLLDTRKTLPGLRVAQKYATRVGGAKNHRMGLYDAFLIKENHILACGSIKAAVEKAKQMATTQWIEVEVETLDEFQQALDVQPDVIMLDNFSNEMINDAIALRGNNKKIKLEASGNVTLDTIKTIAQTGVDYISVGDITKSIKAIDLSLLLRDN